MLTDLLEPAPVLKEGTIYFADNGQMICLHCAGQSALYTGRDLSGQKVAKVTKSDAEWLKEKIGQDVKCERGCTTFSK